jgi:hypothetical protein
MIVRLESPFAPPRALTDFYANCGAAPIEGPPAGGPSIESGGY